MDVPDFDLLNLDDSIFEIDEVVFKDENELFDLTNFMDAYMRKNPTAKSNGVFRGRLDKSLQGHGSNIQEFIGNISASPNAQFMIAPAQPKSFVMELRNCKISTAGIEFNKAVRKKETLSNTELNCCTKALQEGGEKSAVKHFYDAIQSKAVHIEKSPQPDYHITHMRDKYKTRQKILLSNDPITKCALIESSMSTRAYDVKHTNSNDYLGAKCQCERCYMDMQTQSYQQQPENLEEDGNGSNCALYLNSIEESPGNFPYITKNFALAHLCHMNMLTDLDTYYPGVSFPFAYVGGRHSVFALHIEDMSLWSINFLHQGNPKLFIVVAPRDVLKLSMILSHYSLCNLHRTCMYHLGHNATMVFPQFLVHHRISFKIIIQRPGDFVFLAPNAAHTGGNFGKNFADACNVGTYDWLPYGSVAQHNNCSCLEDRVHMNVTPLFKIHRDDLLRHHLSKCMHIAYQDEHFRNSIIMPYQMFSNSIVVPHQMESVGSAVVGSASGSQTKNKEPRATFKPPLACPIEGCFKEYKCPIKQTMVNHINQKHPIEAKDKKIWDTVDSLFLKKTCSLKRKCEDCGSEISVYSNKHKYSVKCLKNRLN